MKNFLLIGLLALVSIGCENFHTVHKDNLYRSAQLSGSEFREKIETHGIRTVINLRGKSDSSWWQEESEVMREMGVEHINIKMSAQRLPDRDDLITLLDAYKNAERPILIHCHGGADRTGEASALYKMLYMGADKKEALDMLKIKYFHIAKRFPAKRYFVRDVWQGESWAYNEYDPCVQEYKHYNPERCYQEIVAGPEDDS